MALLAPEEQVKVAYAQARKGLGARQDVTRQQALKDIERRLSISGPSGAADKLRRKALLDIEAQFGQQEAGLGSEEAQQLGGLAEAQKQREFATSERLGSETFAASESEKQRKLAERQLAQQESQFGRTLEFQQGSFAEQMRQSWAEFDESVKANFVNAAIAAKDAGIKKPEDWGRIIESMRFLFPETVGRQTSGPPLYASGSNVRFEPSPSRPSQVYRTLR